MEVGNGMMFAANVVDGLVHQLGGYPLAQECAPLQCPEGNAVVTSAPGELEFDNLIHTVPPFYNQTDNSLLRDCYTNSLTKAVEILKQGNENNCIRVACPLLGAGCRGFPQEEAIHVAAEAAIEWKHQGTSSQGTGSIALAFGIPSTEIREELIEAITNEDAKHDT